MAGCPPGGAFLGAGGGRPDGNTLGFEREGEPYNPNTFGLTFARIAREAELPRTRLHDLRHSFASLLLAGGADLKTVSTALGHSTIAVTADVYAHVSPAMLHDAAELLDGVVESGRRRRQIAAIVPSCSESNAILAGACRNRTYQSPCDDLSDFEDRASHQTRTLP